MSKIKFAVVGLGHIGKRHADMIIQNNDAKLIALIPDLSGIKKTNFQYAENMLFTKKKNGNC